MTTAKNIDVSEAKTKNKELLADHCSEGICTSSDCDSCIALYESSMRLRAIDAMKR